MVTFVTSIHFEHLLFLFHSRGKEAETPVHHQGDLGEGQTAHPTSHRAAEAEQGRHPEVQTGAFETRRHVCGHVTESRIGGRIGLSWVSNCRKPHEGFFHVLCK